MANWFRRTSPLQAALEKGTAPGGRLAAEIQELEDYTIKSRADAEAICTALERYRAGAMPETKDVTSPLHALTGLFQDVEDAECAAFAVLQERGVPLLARIVHDALDGARHCDAGDLLFVLKILALYATEEGARTILRAARHPFEPEAYPWAMILGAFRAAHPQMEQLFGELSDPLPPGFIAIALLDAANQVFLDGGRIRHPFDSDAGVASLEQWLLNSSPERASYAASATAALPFLEHASRDRLLGIAMRHPDGGVQMEAAWAAAKRGLAEGIDRLAQLCLDVNRSDQARQYLAELERTDAVPATANEPEFQARAEFARWLAHPNELGKAPDTVAVRDHRHLLWPPEFESKPFWLIEFTSRDVTGLESDQAGVGLVGSVTFCFFTGNLEQRPPGDGYAIHCCWELEQARLLKTEAVDQDSTEYSPLLQSWSGQPLANARIVQVAELDPTLRYPRGLVAVATATLAGAPGWAVVDGTDSRWYPAEDFLPKERAGTVLKIHIGRHVLGLGTEASRKQWFKPRVERPPEQLIAAYERQLASAVVPGRQSQSELEALHGLLGLHAGKYLDALERLQPGSRAGHLVSLYGKILEAARAAQPVCGDKAFDGHSMVGDLFEEYVDALVALGRAGEAKALIEFLTPRWQHNLGYRQLGTAAFKTGDDDCAERFFLQLKSNLEEWQGARVMFLLAELWCRRGRQAEAHALLIECLKWLAAEGRQADDLESCETQFQRARATYQRLFPTRIEELSSLKIPSTLMRHVDR